MEAKELQIGDWYNISTKNISINRQVDRFFYQESATHEIMQPIPLTKDILEANGLEVSIKPDREVPEEYSVLECWKRGRQPKDYRMFIGQRSDHDFYYLDIDCSFHPYARFTMHVTYVHELQHILRVCGLAEMADNFKVV